MDKSTFHQERAFPHEAADSCQCDNTAAESCRTWQGSLYRYTGHRSVLPSWIQINVQMANNVLVLSLLVQQIMCNCTVCTVCTDNVQLYRSLWFQIFSESDLNQISVKCVLNLNTLKLLRRRLRKLLISEALQKTQVWNLSGPHPIYYQENTMCYGEYTPSTIEKTPHVTCTMEKTPHVLPRLS